jgi:hypothetical protein
MVSAGGRRPHRQRSAATVSPCEAVLKVILLCTEAATMLGHHIHIRGPLQVVHLGTGMAGTATIWLLCCCW